MQVQEFETSLHTDSLLDPVIQELWLMYGDLAMSRHGTTEVLSKVKELIELLRQSKKRSTN